MPPQPQSAHPAKGVLVVRRISQRKVAAIAGFGEHYVSRALNGYEKATPRFRAAVVAITDMPEHELFHDEPS